MSLSLKLRKCAEGDCVGYARFRSRTERLITGVEALGSHSYMDVKVPTLLKAEDNFICVTGGAVRAR